MKKQELTPTAKSYKGREVITEAVRDEQNRIIYQKYVKCEVCGHANRYLNSTCEMCSNYLS